MVHAWFIAYRWYQKSRSGCFISPALRSVAASHAMYGHKTSSGCSSARHKYMVVSQSKSRTRRRVRSES